MCLSKAFRVHAWSVVSSFPVPYELTHCFLLALGFTGCPASRGPWRKTPPVSGGHAVDLQIHPHASGWGALQAGPGHDSDLLEESGQHGAEEQEENIHAFTQ